METVSRLLLRPILLAGLLTVITAAPATPQLPAPWTSASIGSPTLSGSATFGNGSWTIAAAGTDIWGTADQFQFVYQPVTGDVEVVARVDSVSAASTWSKAGVMIRSSLAANAAHGYALVSAAKGVAFQRRAQTGGLTTHTGGEVAAPPRWVRLVRRGTTLTASSSADGASWTAIGSDTVQLGATAYVGIAVTSHNASARTTAVVSRLTVGAGALPAPQASADIGNPTPAGSARFNSGTYTITGGGADVWGSADQFRYVYQQVSGDVDATFHVTSISLANSWSKAGVMIRETLDAGSAHALTLVSAGRGYAFQRRPVAGGLSENTAGGTGTSPGWVRLKRNGDLFTAYRSADGVQWTLIGSDSIPMAATVYVGIAVCSHNTTTVTTVTGDNFSVSQGSGAQPPTVGITAPANGGTFTAPATIAIAASAADPDGPIAKVEFYNGGALLGSDTAAPYSFIWSSVPAGTYSLTAVAYDATGVSTRSAPVSVTVGTPTTPTSIAFTASADHATLVTSYLLEIFSASANTATGTPLSTLNLGKPAPDTTNTITANITSLYDSLAAGTYQVTVSAVGSGGSSRSAPIPLTK